MKVLDNEIVDFLKNINIKYNKIEKKINYELNLLKKNI